MRIAQFLLIKTHLGVFRFLLKCVFFSSGPPWWPLGGPGRPRDPKMTQKLNQNDPKTTPKASATATTTSLRKKHHRHRRRNRFGDGLAPKWVFVGKYQAFYGEKKRVKKQVKIHISLHKLLLGQIIKSYKLFHVSKVHILRKFPIQIH